MTKPVALHTTAEIATKTMQVAKAAAASGMILQSEIEEVAKDAVKSIQMTGRAYVAGFDLFLTTDLQDRRAALAVGLRMDFLERSTDRFAANVLRGL